MASWSERLRNLAIGSLRAPAPVEQATKLEEQLSSLVELGRKTARATTKLEARLASVEAELAELVSQNRIRDDELFSPLMDALDALDAARAALAAGHRDGTEPGLAAIQQRLGGMFERAGYTRHAVLGGPVDGRLQRVVGAQPDALRPNLSVARVVRAAVTRGDAIVRTGEVIAVQNGQPENGVPSPADAELQHGVEPLEPGEK